MADIPTRTSPELPNEPSASGAAHALLRECFDVFRASASDIATLSIETSADLFELDHSVQVDAALDFRHRRKEWTRMFGESLRQLFEHRLAGHCRKRRRPDTEESIHSLRVLSEEETRKQDILVDLAKQFAVVARDEQQALDLRVAALLGEARGRDIDNPFSSDYLLDAIGMTSRAVYPNPEVWRSVMARVVSDFMPALAKIYIPVNRLLVERDVLPDVGAIVRARSHLHPGDDDEVLPLLHTLINDVDPKLQAWRTLDPRAAIAAGYPLPPLATNPYAAALTAPPDDGQTAPADPRDFPRLDAMMSHGELQPVLETLDRWQRDDPMTAHLRSSAPEGIDASATAVNRIPWIHAALGPTIAGARERNTIDFVGFLFDYLIRDISIPPRLRLLFDGLQVPVLKMSLADPSFFTARYHPARRLINDLAAAAIGADDDDAYGNAIGKVASRIVDTIRKDFGIEARVFEKACATLGEFTDRERVEAAAAVQPHFNAALAEEARDVDRTQVRALVRNRLAGSDLPFHVRAFACSVWASHLKQVRQSEGPASTAFAEATQTLDDLLWSITIKARSGQKSRLSRMIPSLIGRLRVGGAAVQVTGEKMKRFLDALYDLHVAAIRPDAVARHEAEPGVADAKKNAYDLVLDAVKGTWFVVDRGGGRFTHVRLDWISPMRTIYVLAGRARGDTVVIAPEDLAWEIECGRASLVTEPVPLYDRAISATLDFLAARGGRADAKGTATDARANEPHGVATTLVAA